MDVSYSGTFYIIHHTHIIQHLSEILDIVYIFISGSFRKECCDDIHVRAQCVSWISHERKQVIQAND